MKAVARVMRQEGFVADLGIQFDNGLVLRVGGRDLLWGGEKKRVQIRAQFNEILRELVESGYEIDRREFDEA